MSILSGMGGMGDVMRMMAGMGAKPDPRNLAVPYGGRPKFVKLAKEDKGQFLAPIFFEDPHEHNPKPGVHGEIHAWGLYPYDYHPSTVDPDRWPLDDDNIPAFDGILAMMRQMYSQMWYFTRTSPEQQFVKVLKERKRKQLEELDLYGLDKQDVVLKIALGQVVDEKGEPLIWRRFRVSAGIKLSTLQDKAIAPIMGWVRNMHCYTFTDFRDGALFGPEKSDAIDKMHIAQVGYDYMPDGKYSLAHMFSKEGDKIGYLYDFGDKWYHYITIEKILPLADSHGSIEILDGRGACPGENMKGSHNYRDFMKDYFKGSAADRLKKKREILEAPNYTFTGKRPSIPPSVFDPTHFDINAARTRVAEALSSANSVQSGSKKFVMPMSPEYKPGDSQFGKKGKNVETTVTGDPDSWGHWVESQSTVKDSRKRGLCAACGKPGGEALKACGGCRQVLYCSPEHQMQHWKAMHKKQCSRQFMKK